MLGVGYWPIVLESVPAYLIKNNEHSLQNEEIVGQCLSIRFPLIFEQRLLTRF